MKIDEAIEKYRNRAKQYKDWDNMKDIAEEHEQLAEWLEELKFRRVLQLQCEKEFFAGYENGKTDGYKKGIDDFIHSYYEYCEKQYGRLADDELIDMQKVSEKLKEGGIDG